MRLPPHDLAAEQAVLGALMLDAGALDRIEFLAEGDFYRRDHRLIFRAVTELARGNQPCDAVTLADWFDLNGLGEMIGNSAYLLELADTTPGTANIQAYAEIVQEHSRLRQLIDVGTVLAEGAFGRASESRELVTSAADRLAALQQATQRGGLVPAVTPMRAYWAEVTARMQGGDQLLGLATPWNALNDRLGGFEPGTVIIIGARPSMGKSVFGLQLAGHCATHGKNVAVFTPEMTAKRCMARLVSCVGQIPFSFVRNPDSEPHHEECWPRMTSAMGVLNEASLQLDDTRGINIDQLMARARRAHKQRKLDLIVLDHMHDMALNPRAEQRHEYGRIVQGAKVLAGEMDIPVVVLAQLNRTVTGRANKRPTMSDLRESGEIEQKADVILFLHREEYYDKDTHLKGVVEVIPAKGRDLDISETIYLYNRFDQMRLDNYDGMPPEPPAAPVSQSGWGKTRSKP
uniref:DNA 5'-3' helicase n=1 Tax=Mycena chlorophos TaxID=658473 RepID=A0ABQ0KXN4_MYCCL|nr:DNA helicase [Mycena chlorophos]